VGRSNEALLGETFTDINVADELRNGLSPLADDNPRSGLPNLINDCKTLRLELARCNNLHMTSLHDQLHSFNPARSPVNAPAPPLRIPPARWYTLCMDYTPITLARKFARNTGNVENDRTVEEIEWI
jgi:hypothetical protein